MANFMQNLSDVLNEDFNTSVTENGAVGYHTTGRSLLDINFAVSSLRSKEENDIERMFSKAYYENKLLALKWLFFAGDVRGGLGERRLFRTCMKWLICNNMDVAKALISLIPEYTRWDNMCYMLGLTEEMDTFIIDIIKNQLNKDLEALNRVKDTGKNESISLLGKWLPSLNASSAETKKMARIICSGLGLTDRIYRKTLTKLRSYLKVVETYMSKKEWSAIDYSAVPSRANLIYNKAFLRNDNERRSEYLDSLQRGETTINAGVLFPHDIVHKYMDSGSYYSRRAGSFDAALEELWKNLPDFVKGDGNTICVCDGSGSMTVNIGSTQICALEVAMALSIYFAERSSGQFKNKVITFSENPRLISMPDNYNLHDKINMLLSYNEVANTNIVGVFQLILETAVKNNMKQDEMPKNILILSDMEFDQCAVIYPIRSIFNLVGSTDRPSQKLFGKIAKLYEENGYKLPRLVFWNLNSRTGTIPVKENELGVALVSGFSPVICNMVLSNKLDPYECLVDQLNTSRYNAIEESVKNLI